MNELPKHTRLSTGADGRESRAAASVCLGVRSSHRRRADNARTDFGFLVGIDSSGSAAWLRPQAQGTGKGSAITDQQACLALDFSQLLRVRFQRNRATCIRSGTGNFVGCSHRRWADSDGTNWSVGVSPASETEISGRDARAPFSTGKLVRRGFTLVEILVVIVIIAVLAGMGVMVYQGAMVAAKRANCASNMRQLGIGLIAHAQENNGRLPASQHFRTYGSTDSWVFAMKDFFGGEIDEIRICPADPQGPARARNNASSYVLNDFLDSGATDAWGNPLGYGSLNSLSNPSQTMMLFIISDRKGAGAGNDHIHGAGWRSWGPVLADIQPDRHRRGDANADHTNGSANYLFVDGRVESIEASEIKRRIDSGTNIARPPK